MTTYKVSELSGALLDAAVAECGEWKTAHEHFPTMTLDSTFKGWRICEFSDGHKECYLVPNNAFRQDPRLYQPSTDWAIGGPIIQREKITIAPYDRITGHSYPMILDWCACAFTDGIVDNEGCYTTVANFPLIAAMRAYTMAKFGEEVELHD